MKSILPTLCCIAWLLSGCASSVSEQTRAELEKPVDCTTAEQDIALLEQEKASVGTRIESGVGSILPVAAVAGILGGTYSDRAEVAAGQYNADIEAKITDIKTSCRL